MFGFGKKTHVVVETSVTWDGIEAKKETVSSRVVMGGEPMTKGEAEKLAQGRNESFSTPSVCNLQCHNEAVPVEKAKERGLL